MKLILKTNDIEKLFPELMKDIKEDSIQIKNELEKENYKISKIKNSNIKEIYSIMNGIKVDFDFKVKVNSQNEKLDLYDFDQNILTALYLKSDEIVLDFDEKEDFIIEDYLTEKFSIDINYFTPQNYITPGIINWQEITKDVKESWDSSLFFLEKMNDNNFLTENKQLIFDKIKEEPEFLKEAIIKNKNMIFLDYCIELLSPKIILMYIKESQAHLAHFWNKKIKSMFDEANTEKLINKEKEAINYELEKYQEFIYQNGRNSYGDYDSHFIQFDKMRERLNKDFEKRKKEIINKAKEKVKEIEEIKVILNEDSTKILLLKGIFNTIGKEDFKMFEDDILKYPEIKKMVIENGMGKSNCVTESFIKSLNKEEFKVFLIKSEQKLDNYFSSETKRLFAKIVPKEMLLEVLKEDNFKNFKILDEVRSDNIELNHLLFMANPKNRFDDLNKKEITNEHILAYLKNNGYLNQVKEKINIYNIDNEDIITEIVKQDSSYLGNKKVDNKWKENSKIIYAVLNNDKSLEYINLNKENVEKLSKNFDDCLNFVREDKSYYFYKLLPDSLKNNKEIANELISGAKERNYIDDAFKLLSPIVLLDKKFNIDLVKDYPQIAGMINKELWNDKEFVLTLFKEVENSNNERELKKNLPKEIRLFLETFNVNEKFYTFFNNYYLQKKLEEDLKNQPPKDKIKKLKI